MVKKEILMAKRHEMLLGGGAASIEKQHRKGKKTARERLEMLFDAGSFCEIDGFVRHRCTDFQMDKQTYAGDGVVGGYGKVNGRIVYAYAQDFTILGGSMGEEQANKICHIIDLAVAGGFPIVGINDSGGARIQEGVNALSGYGKIFHANVRASGVVPQISLILGPCAGGAVYSPALCDFIFVVDHISKMFITGPEVIKSVLGEVVSSEDIGGAQMHASVSGNAHFVCDTEDVCFQKTRELLGFLPSHYQKAVPRMGSALETEPKRTALNGIVPEEDRKPYDVHAVINEIIDQHEYLEYMEQYARNIVTAFARINGMPVGIIANQTQVMSGCIDISAADKAARFIRTCDAFGLPLVTLVDVPGFLPGSDQERSGIIRHGAKMLYAYCEASVPKITFILRKAFGGAYIAMCSKNLGADFVFAWPEAQIAVMGEDGAANILLRNEENEEARKAWKIHYRDVFINPYKAAERGQIDDIILPEETRQKLISSLEVLQYKARNNQPKIHGNMPL